MKKEEKQIRNLVSKINQSYIRIGIERDKLRDLVDEAEVVVSDMDDAQALLSEVVSNLEEVADNLSKYL